MCLTLGEGVPAPLGADGSYRANRFYPSACQPFVTVCNRQTFPFTSNGQRLLCNCFLRWSAPLRAHPSRGQGPTVPLHFYAASPWPRFPFCSLVASLEHANHTLRGKCLLAIFLLAFSGLRCGPLLRLCLVGT